MIINPSEKSYSLINARTHYPLCWVWMCNPNDGKDPESLYRSGHRTKEDAEAWAVKEGIIDAKPVEDDQGCL